MLSPARSLCLAVLVPICLQDQVLTIPFKPASTPDPTRLPLACWQELGEQAPAPRNPIQRRIQELLANRLRFKDKGERAEIEAAGDGLSWKPLPADKPATIEWRHGSELHQLTFWRVRERWYAGPASTEQAVLQGQLVLSLDADLDGRHFGELDCLRLEDGCFYFCGPDPLVHVQKGLYALRDVSDHQARKAHATPQGTPSNVPSYVAEGLLTINTLRARAGQAPMRIHVPRTLGLIQHAQYVAQPGNEGDVIKETPGRPGYSAEAVEALKWNSVVAPLLHPGDAIEAAFLSNNNRMRMLCSPSEGFASSLLINKFPDRHGGKLGYVWVATGNDTGIQAGAPTVYPAPGQSQVDTSAVSEWPIQEERPDLFATKRGTGIAVYYAGAAWVNPKLTLLENGSKEIKGELFHPDRPAAPKRNPDNNSSAYFWPLNPLKPRTRYWIEFEAVERQSSGDVPVRYGWGFVTGK